MKEKTASVHWEGQISTETGALESYPYGFASRLHSVNSTLAPREVRIPVGDTWLYGDLRHRP